MTQRSNDETTGTLPVVAVPRADIFDALRDCEGVELREWTPDADPRSALGDDAARVELVIWPYPNPEGVKREHLEALPRLRAVQAMTAGVDAVEPYVPDGISLANGAGIHATSTSELAVALTLAKRRQLDQFFLDQQRQSWRPRRQPSLADSRVLIIGVGSIGTAIARRLEPFEVSITRVARTARTDGLGPIEAISELPTLLPEHDIVIVIVPLTDETTGLVDAHFLAAMPDGALLVNVSRGAVVDTDALVAELQTGRIEAAVDVTDPEPLPAGHALWTAPNAIITPHVAGSSAAGVPRLHELLRSQVRAFVAGAELANLVRRPTEHSSNA